MTRSPNDCLRFREALSARLDGEDPGVGATVLDAHVATCVDCSGFADRIGVQNRRLRVRAVDDTPDLSGRILAVLPDGPARKGRRSPARRTVRPFTLMMAAAVVAVVLVAGYVVGGLVGPGGSGGGGGGGVTVQQVAGSDQSNPVYPGATIYPSAATTAKPSVTLTDTAGKPYNLAADTRGRVTLVYFGYTNCPDLCPLNMALTAQALRGLSAAERKRVAVVFVTTDPARDTGPVIRRWLDRFDVGLPAFVGLRGSLAQIHRAERQVHMFLSYAGPAASQRGAYPVVHAGYTLVYSQDGAAHMQVDETETSPEYTATLEHLITSGYQPT